MEVRVGARDAPEAVWRHVTVSRLLARRCTARMSMVPQYCWVVMMHGTGLPI